MSFLRDDGAPMGPVSRGQSRSEGRPHVVSSPSPPGSGIGSASGMSAGEAMVAYKESVGGCVPSPAGRTVVVEDPSSQSTAASSNAHREYKESVGGCVTAPVGRTIVVEEPSSGSRASSANAHHLYKESVGGGVPSPVGSAVIVEDPSRSRTSTLNSYHSYLRSPPPAHPEPPSLSESRTQSAEGKLHHQSDQPVLFGLRPWLWVLIISFLFVAVAIAAVVGYFCGSGACSAGDQGKKDPCQGSVDNLHTCIAREVGATSTQDDRVSTVIEECKACLNDFLDPVSTDACAEIGQVFCSSADDCSSVCGNCKVDLEEFLTCFAENGMGCVIDCDSLA